MPKFRRIRTFERLERDIDDIARPPQYLTSRQFLSEAEKRSPTNLKKAQLSPQWAVKDRLSDGPKASLRLAALLEIQNKLNRFQEADFAEASNRLQYRRLRAAQEAIRQNVKPIVNDRRYYQPGGHIWPSTKYGTAARYSGFASVAGRPLFRRKSTLLPCVQRLARRSVMFALGKAGKGYRTKHRRNINSEVPC